MSGLDSNSVAFKEEILDLDGTRLVGKGLDPNIPRSDLEPKPSAMTLHFQSSIHVFSSKGTSIQA